jgi:hypothetical protein
LFWLGVLPARRLADGNLPQFQGQTSRLPFPHGVTAAIWDSFKLLRTVPSRLLTPTPVPLPCPVILV